MTHESSMSTFTSRRERWLWLVTGSVVVAIYSTLGLATTLAERIGARELLDSMAFLALMVIIGAVLVLGFRRFMPTVAAITMILATVAVYLLVFLRAASPLERSHMAEYSVLALLILEALMERARNGRTVRWPAVTAIVVAALLGVLDETIQWFIPNRVFDPIDIAFNVMAVAMAVTASIVLARIQRRTAA